MALGSSRVVSEIFHNINLSPVLLGCLVACLHYGRGGCWKKHVEFLRKDILPRLFAGTRGKSKGDGDNFKCIGNN